MDGTYGSDESEKALTEEEITLIQTAIRGRSPGVPMQIEPGGDGWQVSCPRGQTVQATRTPKRWKTEFDKHICAECPLAGKCRATQGQTARWWYFTPEDAARQQRWRRWEDLPDEHKTPRGPSERCRGRRETRN